MNDHRLVRAVFFIWIGLVATLSAKAPSASPELGEIGRLVGRILQQEHYRQQAFNDAVSAQFFKLYLDALDYNHLVFLQSDIQEFQKYAATLDDETLHANVQPGFEIFARFIQRLEQRVTLVKELLKESFSFDGDDSLLLDRHEAPWPANEDENRQLWRQRIKYEILQERLNQKGMDEAAVKSHLEVPGQKLPDTTGKAVTQEKPNQKKPADPMEIVLRRYDRLLRAYHEEDAESVLQLYLTCLARAYDPHSDYLSPTELNQFAITMKLSLVGIGAVLTSEDGYAKVVSIVPGGPADLDKRLKINDRIAAVAQGDDSMVDVVDMKLSKAVDLIRGKKNTVVRLLIIPADAMDPSTRVEIRLVRQEIKLTEAEPKARVVERKSPNGEVRRLGYIDLPSFYAEMPALYAASREGGELKSTTRDLSRLIAKLKDQKVDGLILDLRRNGGGPLQEVVSMTGLFIKKGPVVQSKDARGRMEVLNDDDPAVLFDAPLLVLVSHISASASEILAAALQDYGRAVIVGEKSTFGKGTVQKVEELGRYLIASKDEQAKAGAIKITTRKFYRISGGATQHRGVIPDIQLPSERDYLKNISEASQPNALPYDEVVPATHASANRVAACIPELTKRTRERVARDPEFDYIREDIERLKARLEKKSVSLNETQRLQEKQMDVQRKEKRKKERQTRKTDSPKITEITLQSLGGVSSNAPALTRKVIEEAATHMDRSPEEEPSEDAWLDPYVNEGLNVLSDMIDCCRETTTR
ncbi:MAG: carboxy terminal-processing peptidase [Verrucomicrobia bacterium]|nr:carboxy terminal-processing peptidase [Verrucomicrobiota bacterium]